MKKKQEYTKTKNGFIVPDGYTVDINILKWDRKMKDFKILLIKRSELNAEGEPNTGAGQWALPGGFVGPNETALQAAKRELKEETSFNINALLLREGGVFDEPNRDDRGRIVTNSFFSVINKDITVSSGDDAQDVGFIYLNDILNDNVVLFNDHKDIIKKHIDIIKYDISSQAFDRSYYGNIFLNSILGENFKYSALYDLATWAGRKEDKTTYYRHLKKNK